MKQIVSTILIIVLEAAIFNGQKVIAQSPNTIPQQGPTNALVTIGAIVDQLVGKGIKVINIEQGSFLPTFDRSVSINSTNYIKDVNSLLQTKGFGIEPSGPGVTIFDKKLRESGNANPLNRKIGPLKMTNVTLGECYSAIGKSIQATIIGRNGRYWKNPKFNVDLSNLTAREAIIELTSLAGCSVWNISVVQNNKVLLIDLE